jgi:FixJ family two-component response regulator
MSETVTIAIVENDGAMREAIKILMETVGFSVEAFASAEAFLSSQQAPNSACLILDMRMPGMSGFELQRRLAQDNFRLPIIFITAYDSEVEHAKAMAAGAVDVLQKPFSEEALFDAIQSALLY